MSEGEKPIVEPLSDEQLFQRLYRSISERLQSNARSAVSVPAGTLIDWDVDSFDGQKIKLPLVVNAASIFENNTHFYGLVWGVRQFRPEGVFYPLVAVGKRGKSARLQRMPLQRRLTELTHDEGRFMDRKSSTVYLLENGTIGTDTTEHARRLPQDVLRSPGGILSLTNASLEALQKNY